MTKTLKDNKLTTKEYGVVYCEEYVKKYLKEFKTFKIYEIGHKIHCEICDEYIHTFYCKDIYNKNNSYYCCECLMNKIFGDFDKEE